ncbi:hypothetical protein HanRHA438_Chr06g0286841 [Helianthus annuus]|uniref:Post-GPI attachment to proteins factor 3 n=1 Tax=Helianthus annuus TaxID=4232 RepID=A0A251UJM7_HELAN|nr:hypothetical protein HanXRQr2_Chr06g0277611 [Helianthus annuus]KAJ0568664.1 hypothetical protein HanIR_Chr06g0298751 [Helianthus annuus]KAJ0574923.1 hypothetical protein HanHA89_Chr06g0243751 [Helianthus annuus]KAJ0739253.1 hypothetical protein HanLR1_Chr06g0227801 [Helianthus annuus]KAJ0913547.1 hypothetical protein HanRHA438_Chr06g0286841 [Helianthus annuus]
MVRCYWISLFLTFSCCLGVLHASVGDADPSYRSCLNDCEITGCVGEICFPHCNFSSDGASVDGPWYMQELLYLRWKQWDCHSNCKYHCRSIGRKIEQHLVPASVAFYALNLAVHFHGWLSFFILLHYKLPVKADKKPYYEYAGLWHLYALLALNSWFWSAAKNKLTQNRYDF